MADYHPLIARAVAGLEKNTGDARRALYERARTALVAQLRGVQPALSESDVTRERLALEEAIRKVEAESVRLARADAPRSEPAPSTLPMRPPQMPNWDEEPEPPAAAPERPTAVPERPAPPSPPPPTPPPSSPERAAPSPRLMRKATAQALRAERAEAVRAERLEPLARRPLPLARQRNTAAAAPSMLGEQRYVDPTFDQPLVDELDAPASMRVPAPPALSQPAPAAAAPPPALRARPGGERRSLLDAGLKDFRNVVAETNELGEASAWAAKSARDQYGEESEPEPVSPELEMLEPNASHPSLQDLSPGQVLDEPFADEEAKPAAARPARSAGIARAGGAAWGLVRSYTRAIRLVGIVAVVAGLAGLVVWLWPTVQELYSLTRSAEPETAREAPPTARPKITDRIEPGGPQTQPVPTTPPAPGTTPGAAVAQRVVLYEEDPNDPNGKRFVGSAIWRTETVTTGPGQSPDVAIRADVEIPDRKLSMTWSLRRNSDPGLPASHTVEITFKLPPDFPAGGVSNVPGILMKQAEQARGVPLAGLAVKVTNGFFLIGLSASETDRERNLQLLKERSWFDIPVVYNNNRRAILALEKGTPGERAFAEAFAAWRQ